jgi:predicted RND superfamily exporter protein
LVDGFTLRWANTVLDHPLKTIFTGVLVVVILALGLPKLQVSNNYTVFFSDQNADLKALQEFEKTYAKNDNLLIALKNPKGTIDDPNFIVAVEEFTDRAWQTPFANRVDSITNFQHSYGL